MTDQIEYKDYQRLMAKLAHRQRAYLARVGAPMDFDDLMQEASIAFIKARKGFDPTLGVKFSTYLWRAVSNNLRRTAGKRLDQMRGVVSLDEERTEGGSTLHEVIAGENEDPEDRIENRRRAVDRLSRLSPLALKVVLTLNSPPPEMAREIKRQRAFSVICGLEGYAAPVIKLDLGAICATLGMNKTTRTAIIAEINKLAGSKNGD